MTTDTVITGVRIRALLPPIDFTEFKRRLRAWEREHGNSPVLVEPGTWPHQMTNEARLEVIAQLASFGIIGCDVRINERNRLELVELPGEAVSG